MSLADTSAWIEYDRATSSEVDERMTALISTGGPLAVTEPVIMEVLAGARTDSREADLRRMLLRFDVLAFDAATDLDAAMRIYRRCRSKGITPRGMVDCMIAAVTWRHGAALLSCDADLHRVGTLIGFDLDQASRRVPAQSGGDNPGGSSSGP